MVLAMTADDVMAAWNTILPLLLLAYAAAEYFIDEPRAHR